MTSKDPSIVTMKCEEFIDIPPCRWQRNHESRIHKKHLQEFHPTHREVKIAELPSGVRCVVDGNSRAEIWRRFPDRRPETVLAFIYSVTSDDEILALYNTFDQRDAVKSACDVEFGALRNAGIVRKSRFLKRASLSKALRVASGLPDDHRIKIDVNVHIELWKPELLVVDSWGLTERLVTPGQQVNPNVPSAVVGAILMLVRDDSPERVKLFAKSMTTSGGSFSNNEYCGVAYAINAALNAHKKRQSDYVIASAVIVGFEVFCNAGYRKHIGKIPEGVALKLARKLRTVPPVSLTAIDVDAGDKEVIPEFIPIVTATCPHCSSIDTQTVATAAKGGVTIRYHECHNHSCRRKFKTQQKSVYV